MIRLDIDEYCNNCPEFESDVKKDVIHCRNLDFNKASIVNTIITCEHRERCRSIKNFLEEDKETEKQND